MVPAEPAGRISVTLDGSIPLERLVLKRLQTLTGRARQSWLRSLLIEGFILECRALQAVREWRPEVSPPEFEARRPMPPSAPYTLSTAPRFTGNPNLTAPAREPTVEMTASGGTVTKPFAHLRRVIG